MSKTIPTPQELAKSGALVGACIGAQSLNFMGKSVLWGVRGTVTLMLDAVNERPYTLGRDDADRGLAAERDEHDGEWQPLQPVDLRERVAPLLGAQAVTGVPQTGASETVYLNSSAAHELLQARTLVPHQTV